MNIEKEIIHLLTLNGKVVLAGFGRFTTEDIPAEIHPVHHTFAAPAKKVIFIPDESNYDNTLVNHLTDVYSTVKAETINIMNNYINDIKSNIDNTGRHVFEGFGALSKNNEGIFEFQLNEGINLSGESFGMEDFSSQAVKREKTTATEKTKVKKKSKPWMVVLIIIFVLTAAGVTAYFVFPDYVNKGVVFAQEQYHNIKDKLTGKNKTVASDENKDKKEDKKDSKNKDLKSILDKALNEAVDTLGSILETDTTSMAADKKTQTDVPVKDETPKVAQTQGGKMYYIVAGSFKSRENAEKYMADLKSRGYVKATILPQVQNGFYTVAYDAFADKQDATQELKRINDKEQKGAWLSYQ